MMTFGDHHDQTDGDDHEDTLRANVLQMMGMTMALNIMVIHYNVTAAIK